MKLKEKAWACLKYDLESIGKKPIDPALVEAVKRRVEADEEYCEEINESYGDAEEIWGIDTMDRDVLHDFLAKELGFERWPLYMDSEEYANQFYEALRKRYV